MKSEVLYEIKDFQYSVNNPDLKHNHQIVYDYDLGLLRSVYQNTPEAIQLYMYADPGRDPKKDAKWVMDRTTLTYGICDIGCGDGGFLNQIPEQYRRVGIDLTPIENPKFEFVQEDLDEIKSIPACQAYTMFHSLEHVKNPERILKLIHHHAMDQASLIIEVPVLELAQSNNIVDFFTIQHQTHFTIPSLFCLLDRTGWKILEYEARKRYNGFIVECIPDVKKESYPMNGVDIAMTKIYVHNQKQNRQKISQNLCKRQGDEKLDRIIIWGAGLHTEYMKHYTPLFKYDTEYYFIDKNPNKQGKTMYGYPILPVSELGGLTEQGGKFKIVISSYSFQDEILKELKEMFYEKDEIVTLYDSF